MSSSAIKGISHAIYWVRDLDGAAARFRRLGFSLSQHYLHPKSVGTANYNMMFADDYVELLTAIEDNPRNAARNARIDAEGEGIKDMGVLALDADAAFRQIDVAGLAPLPVFDHHRPEGDDTARFRIVYLPPDRLLPGLGIHVNQRVTPELMWRHATTTHANTAMGIAGLVMAADDPARTARPYAQIFGSDAAADAGGGVSVPAGKSRLRVTSPAEIARLFPGIAFKAKPPYVAALELFVADSGKTRAVLDASGIRHRTAPDGAIEVPPDEACGAVLRFVARS
jgi:catechol 2,3-dioxygenase-like lactoylglutathione lyase family enzyme